MVFIEKPSGNFNVPHGRRASNNQKIKLPQKNELMSFFKIAQKGSIKKY